MKEIKEFIESQGCCWVGIQEDDNGKDSLIMFNEPTGSTLAIPIDCLDYQAEIIKKINEYKRRCNNASNSIEPFRKEVLPLLVIEYEYDYCRPLRKKSSDKKPVFVNLFYAQKKITITYTEYMLMRKGLKRGFNWTLTRKYKQPDATPEAKKFNCQRDVYA